MDLPPLGLGPKLLTVDSKPLELTDSLCLLHHVLLAHFLLTDSASGISRLCCSQPGFIHSSLRKMLFQGLFCLPSWLSL